MAKVGDLNQNVLIALIALMVLNVYIVHNVYAVILLNSVLIYLLCFLIFKNLHTTFKYGTIILFIYLIVAGIILYMVRQTKKMILRESFTSEDETENVDKDANEVKKDALRDELDALVKKFQAQSESGASSIDTSKLEKYTDRLKGKIEIKEDDLADNEPVGIDTSAMKHDEIKPDPLKKAQKETYELIDTINILKDTVQSLNPVLNEGKKVMDLFKGLNMDGGDGGSDMGSLAKLMGGAGSKK